MGQASKPWQASEGETLKRLHAEGISLHEITKRMGRSKATVSLHAGKLGLSFDRAATVAATAAAQKDAKARRTALGLTMLGDLEEARLRIGQAASAREFQAAAQGMDALVRSYVNLQRLEPDDGGLGEARGFVGMILAAVQGSVQGVPRLNPTAEVTK